MALQPEIPSPSPPFSSTSKDEEEKDNKEEEEEEKESFTAKAMGCGSNEPLREREPALPPPPSTSTLSALTSEYKAVSTTTQRGDGRVTLNFPFCFVCCSLDCLPLLLTAEYGDGKGGEEEDEEDNDRHAPPSAPSTFWDSTPFAHPLCPCRGHGLPGALGQHALFI